MTGSQHFSPGDVQFQLVYDRGQCAETSYLKNETTQATAEEEAGSLDFQFAFLGGRQANLCFHFAGSGEKFAGHCKVT